MIRFVFAFLALLLLSGINGCDCGNHSRDSESVVESEVPQEMPQQELSDNPLVSLVEDLRKVPVMTQDIFMKKMDAVSINSGYEEDIRGMLDINKENIRHREAILELIFSKDVVSKVTPEMKVALQAHLDESPISDIEMIRTEPYTYPYKYCRYLADLAADNNKHREFFIKKLRCFELEITAVAAVE